MRKRTLDEKLFLTHQKGEIIRDKGGYHKCVAVDEESAIFAQSSKNGKVVNWKKLFGTCANFVMHYKKEKFYCDDKGGYLFDVISYQK